MGLGRFWEVRSTISGHFGSARTHFGGPGAHVKDFYDCCDFQDVPGAKGDSLLGAMLGPSWS